MYSYTLKIYIYRLVFSGYTISKREKRIEDLSKKFYWTVSSAFTNLFYQSFYYIIPIPGAPPAGAAGVSSLIFATAASVVKKVAATLVAF